MSISYTPSHFGICVTDLQRSLRFYCEGLGFEAAETYEIGNEFQAGLEVDGDVDLDAVFIRNNAMAIELLAYRSPTPTGRRVGQPRPARPDALRVLRRRRRRGRRQARRPRGPLLPGTRCKTDAVEMIFVQDPDGVHVELMHSFE